MAFSIRPFSPDDEADCAAIIEETPLWQRHGLSGARGGELLRRAAAAGDGVLVAEDDGRVAGFAWWIVRGAFARSPYLRLIGVAGAKRSLGVGAKLLAAVEGAAATHGRELFLLVSDFNTGAQRFYERSGYTQVGRLPEYVLRESEELIYWKRLGAVPAGRLP